MTKSPPSELAGQRIHMMGIGGAGVSALAQLAHGWGADVSGCDRTTSPYADLVRSRGIPILEGHDASHAQNIDTLVVSSAIPSDHPEIEAARSGGAQILLRGQMLGVLTQQRPTVVVAGAHGKSTTSGMIAHVATEVGADPSVALGATLSSIGGNSRLGRGPWFVVEGDESDRTLAYLHASIAVVTNIERDHHHTFASDEDVFELFRDWVAGQSDDSILVAGPGEALDRLVEHAPGRVVRFGLDDHRLATIGQRLSSPGRHNELNADAALAVLAAMGIDEQQALASLASFPGVGRRFQVIGERAGVVIVDDYAHHPTEVAATIQAARAWRPGCRLAVVFQPHLYSRTQALWQEFAQALAGADAVVLLDIYGAREDPIPGVTSECIADGLHRIAPQVPVTLLDMATATDDMTTLCDVVVDSDVVITMGAGSVTELAPRLLSSLDAAIPAPPEWVERDAPLHKTTTIGTGGPARYFAPVSTQQQLQETLSWAQQNDLPVAVLGLGSNTLVSDTGFAGVAIRLTGELAQITIDTEGARVVAGGGASLAAMVRLCRDAGLSGFEFACAIPGTLGGAVRMNAGAYGSELVDVLDTAVIVGPGGVRDVSPDDLDMQYRYTNISPDEIVCSATVQLAPGDPDAIRDRVKQMQGQRSTSQPRAARSFGSVFRNPVEGEGSSVVGDPPPGAGALIERAGLKGTVVGGARISPKHGNFIENTGSATTADVLQLIELARAAVREQFGVTLHTEVQLLDVHGYRSVMPEGAV